MHNTHFLKDAPMVISPRLVLSRRLRQTPFEHRVFEQGAQAFTVYNHMILSSVYASPEEDYRHLCAHVQIWDVSVERQVEVTGRDALALVELVTPRDLSRCRVGQCMYAPLVDENGGIVNDPVIVRLAPDRFWISVADSDVLLWMKGIAYGKGMDVSIFEPEVSPLAVQGPRSYDLMSDLLGEQVRKMKFFRFIETEIAGTPVVLARSGWSGQGGYEIYLQDASKGLDLWDAIWTVGQQYDIRAGCPNLIDRLESGLLSYGSDICLDNNPLECGLSRFCDLDKPAEYMSRAALAKIQADGVLRKVVHLKIAGDALISPRSTWTLRNHQGQSVGFVTSAAFSPTYETNLSFATVDRAYAASGQLLTVEIEGQESRPSVVADDKWQ